MDTLGSYGRERALCETEEQLLPTRNVNRRAEIPNGQQRGDTQQPTCRKQFFDGRARIPAYQVSVPPTSVPTCMVECRANYSSEKRYIKNAKEPHFLLKSRKPQGKHFSQNHQYTNKSSPSLHHQTKRKDASRSQLPRARTLQHQRPHSRRSRRRGQQQCWSLSTPRSKFFFSPTKKESSFLRIRRYSC